MDIDEWEYLPDDGYLDFNEVGENQIFFGKRNSQSKGSVFDNYFCTSPKSRRSTTTEAASWNQHRRVPKQLIQVPIQFQQPRIVKAPDEVLVEENTKDHVGDTEKTKASKVGAVVEAVDQDTVSQVFFKIMENECDMKMDSPKSGSRGLFPPLDVGAMRFEDKGEAMEIIDRTPMTSPRMKVEKEMIIMDCDKEEGEEELGDSSGGFNFWKWGLTGIGAIFSFGVAAATICVLFFGHQQSNKVQQQQKIRFQIYTDDKVR